jgi:polysaccharide export outer membrane protein
MDLMEIDQKFEPVIESNDILHITISSIDEEVIRPFQRNLGDIGNNQNNLNQGLKGYLVDSNGEIQFPVLGSIPVAGKTRNQVKDQIGMMISEYVREVVVDVRIMNFKVTVLGEVNDPGVYVIEDERVTLPEALGLAGDLSEDGRRENITIIREENGKRHVKKLDITQSEFFNSPFFYLKQNDIIYVEPSNKGVKKSGFIPDIPALLSLFTVVLSVVVLVTAK